MISIGVAILLVVVLVIVFERRYVKKMNLEFAAEMADIIEEAPVVDGWIYLIPGFASTTVSILKDAGCQWLADELRRVQVVDSFGMKVVKLDPSLAADISAALREYAQS